MLRRGLPWIGLAAALLAIVAAAFVLTPLSDWTRSTGGLTPPVRDETVFLATPSSVRPTPVRREPNEGADVTSVVASATAAPAPFAVPTPASGGQRFAFLLLGYGGGGHDGAYLTDSMLVVIVDPSTKTLTLLSLPRDSWVPLVFSQRSIIYNKVNTAYAFAQDTTQFPDRLVRYQGTQGPGNFAMDTVSRLLGIPITYYLGMDFVGFRQMIDAVGGVDVNVPASFSAQYPRNDDPSIDASWTTVSFTRGPEHLNGERAIEFARARESDNPAEGNDFARSRRQRLIMQAFKDRLFQPGGLIHLPQLLGIASQHVDTNYAVPDAPRLAQLALGWKDVTIYQTALTPANYLEDATGPDGTYLAVPNAADHSWAQIRAFTRQLWKDPAVGMAMASTTIVVENDSGAAGLAGRVSDDLIKLGYQVADPISGPYRARSQVVDETGGSATPLVGPLSRQLGLPPLDVATAAPDASAGSGELVLHLGGDAADLSVAEPDDAGAPSSTVGVVKFGVWPYTPPAPTPTTAIVRSLPTPTELPLPLATSPTPGPSRVPPRISPTVDPARAHSAVAVVPSLIGLSESEAQKLIADSGLMTSYVNYQTSRDVPDQRYFFSIPVGHVLSQSPPPGESVPRGTRVLLAIRRG